MRTVNRTVAGLLVPLLAATPITPNQVTLLGLAAGLMAAWRFGGGSAGWLAGALWLQISFVLDNCDGTLARRRGLASGFGSWLDTVSDCVVNVAFFHALGLGLYRDSGQGLWWWTGAVTAAGVSCSYAAAFAAQVHRRGAEAWRHPDPPPGAPAERPFVVWRKRAREDFSLVVLAAALAGHMAWLLLCGLVSSFAIAAASWWTIRHTPGFVPAAAPVPASHPVGDAP